MQNLTINKAINICRADESAEIQATEISGTANVEHMHKVRFNPNHDNKPTRYPGQLKKECSSKCIKGTNQQL